MSRGEEIRGRFRPGCCTICPAPDRRLTGEEWPLGITGSDGRLAWEGPLEAVELSCETADGRFLRLRRPAPGAAAPPPIVLGPPSRLAGQVLAAAGRRWRTTAAVAPGDTAHLVLEERPTAAGW